MPAAHVTQIDESVAPVADDDVPAAQLVQLEAPAAEYVPAPHDEQLDAPAAEKVPAAHAVQVVELVAPVADDDVPASH